VEHATNLDFTIQNLQLYEYKVNCVRGHDFKAFKEKGMDLPEWFSKAFVRCTYK
jgi:hypothetical protein